MKRILIALYLLAALGINAQDKNAERLLDAVKKKFDAIKDYQVDVSIKVDFEFVKVPESKAKIYFKQPDKMKVDSKGFAMLPKQSINFSPNQLLKGKFTSIYSGTENLNGEKMVKVKIIPDSDTSDVILSTFWIDPANSIVRKIETNARKAGALLVELSYDDKKIPLPSFVKFSFNIVEGNFPRRMEDNQNREEKGTKKSGIVGSVTMTYKNYIINKGIPDSFFEERNEK